MRMIRTSLAAMVLAMTALPAAIAPVGAQSPGPQTPGPQGLEMITQFPSVVADPGADVTFTVDVTTGVPERVNLTVSGAPEGWQVRLVGGGSTIAAVSTTQDPENAGRIAAQFDVEVTVPANVQAASNQVVINGESASGLTSQLQLDIVTEAQEPGQVTLTTDFPNLRGEADTAFSYSLTLSNDTNTQQTFGLEVLEVPVGWRITARPQGEEQAATAVVDAGDDATITVTADAPADETAGVYEFAVRAVSESIQAEIPLSVEITGNFGMEFDTTDGRLNARVSAGSPTVLNLVVRNTGSAPLTDVSFSPTPPRGWQVTFSPETISEIQPTATQSVTATITASNEALAGDYVLTIRASSTDANDSVEIRTTVETSPIGYLIGIAVLVAVAIGLFVVFQRYGRR